VDDSFERKIFLHIHYESDYVTEMHREGDRGHTPMTSQLELVPLPLNVLIRLWGCWECSDKQRGAKFRTMASPTLEPPPSSEMGVLAAVSFPLLWLLFPEVKQCATS
jgi:hypothetical protein